MYLDCLGARQLLDAALSWRSLSERHYRWGGVGQCQRPFAYTIYNKVKDTRRVRASDDAATTYMAYLRSDINRVICVMALLVIFAIIFSLT